MRNSTARFAIAGFILYSINTSAQLKELTTDQMLKGNTIRTKLPMWELMMKNVYSLNTYSLSLEDFKLNVLYADDTSGADYNYLPVKDVGAFANGNPLIRVLGLDKLNRQQDAKPDGILGTQ